MTTASSASSTYPVRQGKRYSSPTVGSRPSAGDAVAALLFWAAPGAGSSSPTLRGLFQHGRSFTAPVSLHVYASDALPIYVTVQFEELRGFAVKPEKLFGHPDGYPMLAELEDCLSGISETLCAERWRRLSDGTPGSVPHLNALLYAGGLVVSGESGWLQKIDWSAEHPIVHLEDSGNKFIVDNSRTPVLWNITGGGWNSGVPASCKVLQVYDVLA